MGLYIKKPEKINPPRILLYGTEKIGKSSFAACSPNPVFLFTEDGVSADVQPNCFYFDEQRYVARSTQEIEEALVSLYTEQHDYKTLVVDSITFLEKLVWKDLCEQYGQESITSNKKGSPFAWSRGYELAIEQFWNPLLVKLDKLRNEKGMAIILIAHAKQKIVSPPDAEEYFQYCPDIQSSSEKLPARSLADLIGRWVDGIFFVQEKIIVTQKEDGKFKAASVNQRVLHTERSPSFVAGNRFDLPAEIEFKKGTAWREFEEALTTYNLK